jgi:hypothetical protein
MQFLSQTLNEQKPNYIFVTVNTKDIPHLSLFLSLKIKIILLLLKNILKTAKNNSAQRQSFDSSDMIYLLMPDRFANGNTQNDNDATHRKIQS